MKQDEVRDLLAMLRTAYPQSYKSMPTKDQEDTLRLWYLMFKGESAKLAQQAVMSIINTDRREFAPTIGQIKCRMAELADTNPKSAEEVWNTEVRPCMRALSWYREEDRKKYEEMLSEKTKRLISFDEIYTMAQSNPADNDRYRKPSFMKAFDEMTKSDRVQAISDKKLAAIGDEGDTLKIAGHEK